MGERSDFSKVLSMDLTGDLSGFAWIDVTEPLSLFASVDTVGHCRCFRRSFSYHCFPERY